MSGEKKILIIGNGAWGGALSLALHGHTQVQVCTHHAITNAIHSRLQVTWPTDIAQITYHQLPEALEHTSSILITTASNQFRQTLQIIKPHIRPHHQIAWGTKGMEPTSNFLMCEVVDAVLPHVSKCAISGPSFAIEVAKKKPTALVFASENNESIAWWHSIFKKIEFIQCHAENDIKGVCLIGCLKNVLAIVSGICTGLGLGQNAINALVSQGISEIKYILEALRCNQTSLFSPAGIGDIMLTCFNAQSRNHQFGLELSKNLSPHQALENVSQTVEGYNSSKAIHTMLHQQNIQQTPLFSCIYEICHGETQTKQSIYGLFNSGKND